MHRLEGLFIFRFLQEHNYALLAVTFISSTMVRCEQRPAPALPYRTTSALATGVNSDRISVGVLLRHEAPLPATVA